MGHGHGSTGVVEAAGLGHRDRGPERELGVVGLDLERREPFAHRAVDVLGELELFGALGVTVGPPQPHDPGELVYGCRVILDAQVEHAGLPTPCRSTPPPRRGSRPTACRGCHRPHPGRPPGQPAADRAGRPRRRDTRRPSPPTPCRAPSCSPAPRSRRRRDARTRGCSPRPCGPRCGPRASTNATWRTARSASARTSVSSASGALRPRRISSRPSGPYERSAKDWVATAPTPASAHETTLPTENQCDCTATPRRPVSESRATIE